MSAIRLLLPFPPRGSRGYRLATWGRVASTEIDNQHPGFIDGPYDIAIDLGGRDRAALHSQYVAPVIAALRKAHVVGGLPRKIQLRWSDRVSGCRVTLRPVASPAVKARAAA